MKASWKGKSLAIVGLGLSGALIFAPAKAQVSTTANGPYYATPSWDQKITTGRFVVLANWNNEAVLDRETGLVWEQTPSQNIFPWSDASANCVRVSKGGRKGWRLPTIQELGSLIDPTVPAPNLKLPPGHPFSGVLGEVQGLSLEYWSVTTVAADATGAWTMTFGSAFERRDVKTVAKLFWCVRGGVDVGPQ